MLGCQPEGYNAFLDHLLYSLLEWGVPGPREKGIPFGSSFVLTPKRAFCFYGDAGSFSGSALAPKYWSCEFASLLFIRGRQKRPLVSGVTPS